MSDVVLVGNLTRDPEVRYTPNGSARCGLGLAVNRAWNDPATGDKREATSFFDVIAWGDLAENIAESLTKGCRVVVAGRLDQRSWEAEDGSTRRVVEVVANAIGPDLRFATATVARVERTAEPAVRAVS
jgi:single-strand DNA-binding protein